MTIEHRTFRVAWTLVALTLTVGPLRGEDATSWPPALKGAKHGTVTLRTEAFLTVPDVVDKGRKERGASDFVVARTAPTIEFAYHGKLGDNAIKRRLWSSWGDIALASDGSVYSAIGDHGNDVGGDARCFVYRWDPARKLLEQVVDLNQVVPPRMGQPAWSKVHAKIDEGPDGKIYFSATLNDGNRAALPTYKWNKDLPGGQIYQYDPKSGKTVVFANLPPARCTATSLLDRARGVWWCNLEAGPNAMWALDMKTRKELFKAPDGTTAFNRAFALARDGSVYFNGKGSIWKADATSKQAGPTRSAFPEAASKNGGMRAASRESKDGVIYGVTHRPGQLFAYRPAKDELTMHGPAWLTGDYITVVELSPDERFLYYLPGAHGGAFRHGTPVVQYEIATGRRKVLAFLAKGFETEQNYTPAGTYGMKVSADGGTLYVNFNGHPGDSVRPKSMRPNGFGLCGFAAIHIPKSER